MSQGRKLLFETPAILFKKCQEYFKHNDANPLFEYKPHVVNGEIQYSKTPKYCPYTLSGLRIFLKIHEKTWSDYRKKERFAGVCKVIEEIIRDNKFRGASVGLFNHAIIARDLGLTEKSEVHQTSVLATVSDPIEEIRRRGIPMPDINIEDMEDD